VQTPTFPGSSAWPLGLAACGPARGAAPGRADGHDSAATRTRSAGAGSRGVRLPAARESPRRRRFPRDLDQIKVTGLRPAFTGLIPTDEERQRFRTSAFDPLRAPGTRQVERSITDQQVWEWDAEAESAGGRANPIPAFPLIRTRRASRPITSIHFRAVPGQRAVHGEPHPVLPVEDQRRREGVGLPAALKASPSASRSNREADRAAPAGNPSPVPASRRRPRPVPSKPRGARRACRRLRDGNLLDARRAPGRPEVDEDDLAAPRLEVDRAAVEGPPARAQGRGKGSRTGPQQVGARGPCRPADACSGSARPRPRRPGPAGLE